MATNPEKLFGQQALARRWISPAQLEEALALQQRLKQQGKVEHLGYLMAARNMLNLEQVSQLLTAQGKQYLKCPDCGRYFNIGAQSGTAATRQCPHCKIALVSPEKTISSEMAFPRARVDLTLGLDGEEDDPLTGKVIDGARIEAKIGEGGMGRVYKAKHLKLDKYECLKILPPELSRHPEMRERFLREARAAAKLEHPHIITIHNVAEEQGHYFIRMQFVEGRSLQRLIEERHRLGSREVAGILKQVLSALQFAHERGIVHRDIKPDNILLDRHGAAKLADFGLARVSNASLNLSKTGDIMGTPYYMSPEQAEGREADPRSDLYSVGVMAYYFLTGRRPFEGDTPLSVMMKQVKVTPPPLHKTGFGVHFGLARVVEKLMSKNPDARFASAGEALQALEILSFSRSGPTPLEWMKANRSVLAGCGAGLFLLWAILTFLGRRSPESEAPAPGEVSLAKVTAKKPLVEYPVPVEVQMPTPPVAIPPAGLATPTGAAPLSVPAEPAPLLVKASETATMTGNSGPEGTANGAAPVPESRTGTGNPPFDLGRWFEGLGFNCPKTEIRQEDLFLSYDFSSLYELDDIVPVEAYARVKESRLLADGILEMKKISWMDLEVTLDFKLVNMPPGGRHYPGRGPGAPDQSHRELGVLLRTTLDPGGGRASYYVWVENGEEGSHLQTGWFLQDPSGNSRPYSSKDTPRWIPLAPEEPHQLTIRLSGDQMTLTLEKNAWKLEEKLDYADLRRKKPRCPELKEGSLGLRLMGKRFAIHRLEVGGRPDTTVTVPERPRKQPPQKEPFLQDQETRETPGSPLGNPGQVFPGSHPPGYPHKPPGKHGP